MNKTKIAEVSTELQALQRQRAWHIKSRNMMSNRLQATVAGMFGYNSGLKEAERKKLFVEAGMHMKKVGKGEAEQNPLILTGLMAIKAFEDQKKATEKEMLKLAKQLPVAKWVEKPEQRGFGLLFLAIVVGESGDLSNYANPGKLWRRFGCAPYPKGSENLMGATWRGRSNGKHGERLHAADWELFGYSPRRRSIAFLIGENIVKQNWIVADGDGCTETDTHSAAPLQSNDIDESGDRFLETESENADSLNELDTAGECRDETGARIAGPYRERYDKAKARAAEVHPEWVRCDKCEGTGSAKDKKCTNCKGTGELWMHCHRHGMLLATKLLLKKLWQEWNQSFGEVMDETEPAVAEVVEV